MQADILERVRQVPGVISAGWATMHPLSGRDRGALVEVPGFMAQTDAGKRIHLAAVSPEYFDTLGITMLLGRGFTAGDHGRAGKVAILNETAARFYFGNRDPIGRSVQFTNYPSRDLQYEVVGVVRDTIHDNLRESASRFIYLPIPQHVEPINRLALAVRCAGSAISVAEPAQRLIQSARSRLLVTNVSTMEKQIKHALLRERLVATLSTAFGSVALVLASIGLPGLWPIRYRGESTKSGSGWPWVPPGRCGVDDPARRTRSGCGRHFHRYPRGAGDRAGGEGVTLWCRTSRSCYAGKRRAVAPGMHGARGCYAKPPGQLA